MSSAVSRGDPALNLRVGRRWGRFLPAKMRAMANLGTISFNSIRNEAEKQSGFFQCPTCGLLWFGRYNSEECPEGPHGKPVQVAMMCRECDSFITIDHLAEHLASVKHERL